MKNILLTALIIFCLTASAQEDKVIESKITAVTVFLNRAQITREAKVRIEPGKSTLRLKGLTSQLDQQSIQVSGKGAFTILGISHGQNYLNEFNTPKSLTTLRDSLDYKQRQIAFVNSQKEILNREEQMLLANQKIGGGNQNLTAAELKAMADFFRTRLTDIIQAKMKYDQQLKKLNEQLVKFQRQLNEENDLYQRNTSEILVSVSAEGSVTGELTINYIMNNAGWAAVYDIRALNTKSPIQLNYKANVFQNTGEEWKNVKLKLSTGNPSLGGLKPELSAWYLSFYQPPVRVRGYSSMPSVNAPIYEKAEADQEEVEVASAPAQSTADYVSTVQTALNTEFDIALPYTVSSAAKPTMVEIRSHPLKADYIYSVVPKLDEDAFLIARATGWEDFSLLPGEANIFFEGTFVGKSYIDPNTIRDTLSVSLGRDKRIVVKREKLKDRSSRKLIGANQRESRAFEISIRNTKTEQLRIIVEDQIPVSKTNQIEVSIGDLAGGKYDANTGKIVWELVLQPNETKKFAYAFEVKYPKDKTVIGLE